MHTDDFKLSTHLSIVWGVMLAILTLIEWNGLGRDPMKTQILSPFIQRDITVYDVAGNALHLVEFEEAVQRSRAATGSPRIEIELLFNGPFFLVCFFAPVAAFRSVEWLVTRLLSKSS